MIQKPERPQILEDVNKIFQDWFNNFGIEDLKPSGVLSESPTADQLGPGQVKIAFISGVPTLYIKNLSDVLYKITAVPA